MSKESVVVCGTGIAGLACAAGLARAGFPVTLLGPRRAVPAAQPDHFCPRVYAISPASRDFLQGLGVWDSLPDHRVTPVHIMDIRGDASGHVVLDAWQASETTLAWIIESTELERVLQQAVSLLGVHWVAESFASRDATGVVTDKGRTLPATLLVGADGAASPVRQAAGIAHTVKAYGHTGVVAHFTADRPHLGVAYQWFTGDSVLALLPLPDTVDGPQVSMVWSMPEDQAAALLNSSSHEQAARLASQLGALSQSVLGRLQLRSSVHGFPLTLERSAMIAPAVALVGDAAHRVHPLAGQGLNLGLGDVNDLIRCLRDKESFRSIADERVLARYRRSRAEPVGAMGMATDGLHRLFSTDVAPVVMARNAGMQLVNRLPSIKRWLIASASGNKH